MNLLAPVSTIMATHLKTVSPSDPLTVIRDIFQHNRIHHIPVVEFKKVVGIISSNDFAHFIKGFSAYEENFLKEIRLRNHKASEIMTKGLAKLESTDRINVAVEVFKENLFHAIPVVDNDELVGIVTTFDIIKMLSEEK